MIVAGTKNLQITIGDTWDALDLTMLDSANSPVDLTGYNVESEVREDCGTTVILDLAPTITDAGSGIVTIPEINRTTTLALPEGAYRWDLFLGDGVGSPDHRHTLIGGRFDIVCKITDS